MFDARLSAMSFSDFRELIAITASCSVAVSAKPSAARISCGSFISFSSCRLRAGTFRLGLLVKPELSML
ncbi:Uncharacterised protein [Vibrio cholerae]|nr:Uncharacterised protein [Vibrio cholerae]